MLTATARALWPFSVRFSARRSAWIASSAAWLCAPGDQFPDAKLLMFKSSAIGRRG
jgi:hypothetical protein